MNEYDEELAVAAGDAARQRRLDDDLRSLVDRGLALAGAEVELQKARATYAAGKAKTIAVLGGLALAFAFFALVALTVGLVITLTPVLGALGATFAVFGGLVIIALICGLAAMGQWKRMLRALSNQEDQ